MVTKRSTAATKKPATTKPATRKRTVKKVELVEEPQQEESTPQTDPRLKAYLDEVEEPATEKVEPSFTHSIPLGEDGLEPLEGVPPSTDFEFGKQWVNLGLITLDAGTQLPERRSEATIADYAQQMLDDLWDWERDPLPALNRDQNGNLYPGDGHHRIESAGIAGKESIYVEVRPGGLLKAKLHSAQANRFHGLQLTNKDKRAKCELVFSDPQVLELLAAELGQPGTIPSDRVIAEYLGVSAPLVGQVRKECEEKSTVNISSERVDKKGRTIKTGNIGKKPRITKPNSPPDKADTSTQISENLATPISQPAISENLAAEMSEVLKPPAPPPTESKFEHITTEADIDRNAKLQPECPIAPFEQKVIKQACNLYKPKTVVQFALEYASEDEIQELYNLLGSANATRHEVIEKL